MPTVEELRNECKRLGLSGYWSLRKTELIQLVRKHTSRVKSKTNTGRKKSTRSSKRVKKDTILSHSTNDAIDAVNHLYNLVSQYPSTTSCRGVHGEDWLEYLVESQHYHPKICVKERLIMAYGEDEDGMPEDKLALDQYYRVDVKAACTKDSKVILIPLSIWTLNDGKQKHKTGYYRRHSNMLIVNTIDKTIELFDSHGTTSANYRLIVRQWLEDNHKVILGTKGYRIILPYTDECPTGGPQSKNDRSLFPCNRDSYCQTYAVMYAHLRMLAPQVTPEETMDAWMSLPQDKRAEMVLKYVSWQEFVLDEEGFASVTGGRSRSIITIQPPYNLEHITHSLDDTLSNANWGTVFAQ